MEPPAITRRRRPFLAPLGIIPLAVLAAVVIAWGLYRSVSTTVVVLVRPVEKELGTIDDPPLSPEGELRAQRLAQMFGEGKVVGRLDGVYVSNLRRALQTAAPLADRLGKRAVVLTGKDARSIARQVLDERSGGTALVIAGGTVIPQLVDELGGARIQANIDDSDSVYIVSIPTFGRAAILRLRY